MERGPPACLPPNRAEARKWISSDLHNQVRSATVAQDVLHRSAALRHPRFMVPDLVNELCSLSRRAEDQSGEQLVASFLDVSGIQSRLSSVTHQVLVGGAELEKPTLFESSRLATPRRKPRTAGRRALPASTSAPGSKL